MESPPTPEVVIDGATYLYFGGTGYLGLAAHPEVIEAGCSALRRYGVHSATSRARIGTNPPVRQVEEEAARFFGCEEAFYFGSGYAANHILVAALAAHAEAIVIDAGAHYCVQEAARSALLPIHSFRHRDPDDLAELLQNISCPLVMVDAVCPSTGELAPLEAYLSVLSRRPRAILSLDDAHGFGVLGPRGRGLLDTLGLWEEANHLPRSEGTSLFVGGTLAKALGGFGGILPGTAAFVSHARRSSHYFDGASAPASAVAGSSAKALQLILADPSHREHLLANARHLREGLRALGLAVPDSGTAHMGVRIEDAPTMQALHSRLKDRGILVPYVAEYTGLPEGGVLRFAVFATHLPEQIDFLLSELRTIL